MAVGFWKDQLIQQAETGYLASGGYAVCGACLADGALVEFVAAHASSNECSFCGRQEGELIAADTDDVLRRISEAVRREWGTPESEALIWDSEDQRWAGVSVLDFAEVLGEEPVWPFANDDFGRFVLEAFSGSEWCAKDPIAVSESEALDWSWRDFRRLVMHETRYFFDSANSEPGQDEADPGYPLYRGSRVLSAVGRMIQEFDLTATLTPDEPLFRIRVHDDGESLDTAAELGTPPPSKASQNRMSPAGIPLLYVASTKEVAIAETVDETEVSARSVTVAEFRVREPVMVVDFSALPQVPSIFTEDEGELAKRPAIGFLNGFRRDLSTRIERDDRIHIDYVPTQVVCEYVRTRLKREWNLEAAGLAFESARAEGRNWALFVDNDHCLDPGENLGRLSKPGPVVELVGVESTKI